MAYRKKIMIDMWYGDKASDADKISVNFYPNDGEYRGNIYKDGRAIGDYVCADSLTIEKVFNQLVFNW